MKPHGAKAAINIYNRFNGICTARVFQLSLYISGYVPGHIGMSQGGRDSNKDAVILRWSTPKTMALDLQYCSSVYRVTPADVRIKFTLPSF